MKLGIFLTILGGAILGANLWVSLALLSLGDSPHYIFTGLILPGILIFWGICRMKRMQANEKTH